MVTRLAIQLGDILPDKAAVPNVNYIEVLILLPLLTSVEHKIKKGCLFSNKEFFFRAKYADRTSYYYPTVLCRGHLILVEKFSGKC